MGYYVFDCIIMDVMRIHIMTRKPVNTAQFSVRIPQQMKDRLQAAAVKQNMDGMTWIRQAISEKLERDEYGNSNISNDELDARIEAVLRRIEKEREEKQNG